MMGPYPTDRESLERDSDQEFFIASGRNVQDTSDCHKLVSSWFPQITLLML